jgi:hypothetical protein
MTPHGDAKAETLASNLNKVADNRRKLPNKIIHFAIRIQVFCSRAQNSGVELIFEICCALHVPPLTW